MAVHKPMGDIPTALFIFYTVYDQNSKAVDHKTKIMSHNDQHISHNAVIWSTVNIKILISAECPHSREPMETVRAPCKYVSKAVSSGGVPGLADWKETWMQTHNRWQENSEMDALHVLQLKTNEQM